MNRDTSELSADTETTNNNLEEAVKTNFRKLFHEWIFFQMKFIREEGLAIPQLFTLRYLYYNHPKTLSSIADFMGVSKPTVTGIMNTLEKDGFVRRMQDPDDRRSIDLVLTKKSLDLFCRFETRTKFVLDEFLQSVPQDSISKLNCTMTGLAEKLRETVSGRDTEDER